MKKRIMSIVMDSRTPQEPKPDADKNIALQLLKLVAPKDVAADFEHRLRAGGLGYGDLKKALFEHYWNYFAAARARRAELVANRDYVEQVLRDGAEPRPRRGRQGARPRPQGQRPGPLSRFSRRSGARQPEQRDVVRGDLAGEIAAGGAGRAAFHARRSAARSAVILAPFKAAVFSTASG